MRLRLADGDDPERRWLTGVALGAAAGCAGARATSWYPQRTQPLPVAQLRRASAVGLVVAGQTPMTADVAVLSH